MKYEYEDLSYDQFETLVINICKVILGDGVQGFAKGRDGGIDGRFCGKANTYPSKSEPWNGIIIIQAKHTNGYNESCSDLKFFNYKKTNTVIGKEIDKIKKLKEKNEIDYYMIFTNRKVTSGADSNIRSYISENSGLPKSNICLCGKEAIESFLYQYEDIVNIAKINPIEQPLLIISEDLAEVIEALANQKENIIKDINSYPVNRTSYEEKINLNNMSEDYSKYLIKNFLKETPQIQEFLGDPINQKYLEYYKDAIDEFQSKITAHRKDYTSFDNVFNYILDLLFGRDYVLRKNKKLTRAMLFYMFWNCDIGRNS